MREAKKNNNACIKFIINFFNYFSQNLVTYKYLMKIKLSNKIITKFFQTIIKKL